MAKSTQTFSESWHRVAHAKVTLRPSITHRRVYFRGERWHVVEDPFNNQFFRLRPAAWDFVARLDGRKTVEECWQESLQLHPEEAPGQEEVVQLLGQLFQNNLIRSDLSPDSVGVFERYRKRRHRELRSKLSSILFLRVPLLDPDAFLKRTLPLATWLFTRWGFLFWLLLVGSGIKVVVDNWSDLASQTQSIIAPSNLPLLYVSLALIKMLHELGHGYACRKYGGEVHILGMMLLVFTPVPYLDASSSWKFRTRWQRVTVSAAGMYVELIVAAVAAWVWASTGPGLVHSLAYNLMFIASVSTILFNLNPLLRFDGYYILTDLIGIPNLNQRSNRQWRHTLEKWGFGLRRSVSPSNTRSGAGFYLFWGAAAWIYRIFLFAGILFFVADRFMILGVLIALTGVITWVVVPLSKAGNYLARSSKLERNRPRALLVTAGLMALVFLPLAFVPLPHSFSAPGILRSENYTIVYSRSSGFVQANPLPSGTQVEADDLLLTLNSPDLEAEAHSLQARLEEGRARERDLLDAPGEGLGAIREQIAALEQRVEEVQRQLSNLEVRAPVAGIWVAPEIESFPGIWLGKGRNLGEIIDPTKMEFAAVVSQNDAAWLFSETIRDVGVRLRGLTEEPLAVLDQRITPTQQRLLPSPALGLAGGGDVAVAETDQSGREAAESFFELVAEVQLPESIPVYHGQSGKLRCTLPPEPLLPRGIRALRQLLQKRSAL